MLYHIRKLLVNSGVFIRGAKPMQRCAERHVLEYRQFFAGRHEHGRVVVIVRDPDLDVRCVNVCQFVILNVYCKVEERINKRVKVDRLKVNHNKHNQT